jgi:hypothetical protein
MRPTAFVAEARGDWSLQCHKARHTMKAMSHELPSLTGVDRDELAGRIRERVPGCMAMAMGSGGSRRHGVRMDGRAAAGRVACGPHSLE